jgi:hypothetical protein
VDLEPVKVVDEGGSPSNVITNSPAAAVIDVKNNETRIGENDCTLLYNYNWTCDHERVEPDLHHDSSNKL